MICKLYKQPKNQNPKRTKYQCIEPKISQTNIAPIVEKPKKQQKMATQ